jgi:hypothetical protein
VFPETFPGPFPRAVQVSLWIGPRWARLRLSRRGARIALGPRLFRFHGGAGGRV